MTGGLSRARTPDDVVVPRVHGGVLSDLNRVAASLGGLLSLALVPSLLHHIPLAAVAAMFDLPDTRLARPVS
jgi:hypothetical protein